MKISIQRFEEMAAAVSVTIDDLSNACPDNDVVENLQDRYDILYSVLLDFTELLKDMLSSIEK